MTAKKKGWIGCDLDGTLAHHDGWKGHTHIGEPIRPMQARVKRWLADGRDVRIFTARMDNDNAKEKGETIKAIKSWCKAHLGRELPITNVKDKGMEEIWDDRAVGVVRNEGHRTDQQSNHGLYED